jgi:hypothetical protein
MQSRNNQIYPRPFFQPSTDPPVRPERWYIGWQHRPVRTSPNTVDDNHFPSLWYFLCVSFLLPLLYFTTVLPSDTFIYNKAMLTFRASEIFAARSSRLFASSFLFFYIGKKRYESKRQSTVPILNYCPFLSCHSPRVSQGRGHPSGMGSWS